jgi:glucose-6-phosphate 1-dehydrogenase
MTQQPHPAVRPVVFVLFGATGDLARRMVLPAGVRGLLPRQWLLVGNGRGDITHENFRAHVHDALSEFGPKPDGEDWDSFAQRVFFAGGGFSSGSPGSLPGVLGDARASLGGGPQLVHYLAVPPVAFGGLTQALGQHGLADGARVVYEKPFGTSPGTFRELDRVVHSVLDEQQVYRIDHFLGKEATQDLHLLRFANGSSAAYWNRRHVESVQIDVPETLGISDRAQFYDATGAVLDMLVTHLFQVAAEVAMEPPASLDAPGLQAAREQVISCFRPLDPNEVVLGQFDGYRQVPGVDPHSGRDTFVAARLWIANPRWRHVPFYLRTGKRMAASKQRVSLILREPPGPLSGQLPRPGNVLSLLAGRRRADRPVPGGKKARARAGPRHRPRVDPAGQPARGRPAATVRAADPRRPARRPLAIHPPRRAGRGVAGGRAAADQPAPGPPVRARLMGASRSPRAHSTRAMAPGPVTTRPRPAVMG